MEPVATPSAPADAGAKAFNTMAEALSAIPVPQPKVETVTVVAEPAPEVQAIAAKVEEYGSTAIPLAEASPEIRLPAPKAPRKPRAKKEPVKKETGWPFPGNVPAEGTAKPAVRKPAVRTAKAK